MDFLKKLWKYLDTIVVIILAMLAAFGIISIKKKFQQKQEENDTVKPDEIKPGYDTVKPDTFDPKPNNPFDNDYEVVTPDGNKIDTPIPDDKIDEIIQPNSHVVGVEPKHDKKSNNLLDKIRKYKTQIMNARYTE